jgi:hypothetical protein
VSFVDEIVSKANSMVTNEQFVSKLKLIDTAKLYKVSILSLLLFNIILACRKEEQISVSKLYFFLSE